MRWPWIVLPRTVYDDMRAERDRLLTLVERAFEHKRKMERRDAGLPEREPDAVVQRIVLDSETVQACEAWGASASEMKRNAVQMLRDGKTKMEVLAALTPEPPT